ncbi:MAG: hypothetical protein IJQ98_05935 [Oscillospiraceae bacterium]|nr:hypothetical protein [Oscillospiraceae bacterium]
MGRLLDPVDKMDRPDAHSALNRNAIHARHFVPPPKGKKQQKSKNTEYNKPSFYYNDNPESVNPFFEKRALTSPLHFCCRRNIIQRMCKNPLMSESSRQTRKEERDVFFLG